MIKKTHSSHFDSNEENNSGRIFKIVCRRSQMEEAVVNSVDHLYTLKGNSNRKTFHLQEEFSCSILVPVPFSRMLIVTKWAFPWIGTNELAISVLERSIHAPTSLHAGMINRLLRYISSTPKLSFMHKFLPRELRLSCFCNADWAGCQEILHLITNIFIQIYDSAAYFNSKLQKLFAFSSTEA